MIDSIANLIDSIATLLWPIFSFILLIIHKKDISSLFKRIKRGTLFGNEVELDLEIDQLKESVEKSEIPLESKKSENYSSKIIELSSKNPRTGLIELSIEMEKTIRNLMYSSGWFNDVRNVSVVSSFDFLTSRGILPRNTLSSLKIFWELRNKIIHGEEDVQDSEIIRVIDIGLSLLEGIKAIPQTIHTIHKINVSIFDDKECTRKNVMGSGILLEETSPGKSIKEYRIFPTTKKDYQIGMQVSWEWNMNNIWKECYYIDPVSGKKMLAWSSSAEFIGRDISHI